MTRALLVAGLLLVAPAAWAQNTIVPGQWASDIGWKAPQSYGPGAAAGIGPHTVACGPEAWSTDTMSYSSAPCGGATGAAPSSDVGFSGPVVPQTGPDATSSSSMLHQEMKQVETAVPAQSRAVVAESYFQGSQNVCDPASVAITDEYGFKYNCRGDRIR